MTRRESVSSYPQKHSFRPVSIQSNCHCAVSYSPKSLVNTFSLSCPSSASFVPRPTNSTVQKWRQIGVKTFNWRVLVLMLTALPNRMSTWIKLKFRSQACQSFACLPALLPLLCSVFSHQIILPPLLFFFQSPNPDQPNVPFHNSYWLTDWLADTRAAELNPSPQPPTIHPSTVMQSQSFSCPSIHHNHHNHHRSPHQHAIKE